MENDGEVKGEENQVDFGGRVYDPRIGKFLSMDPLTQKYAYYSPYQFAGNKPLVFIDIDGGEVQIPYLYKFAYENNIALNGLNVVANTGVNLINGGIQVVNSAIYTGYSLVTKSPSQVGSEIKSEFQELGKATSQFVSNLYTYHTKTPLRQQARDFGMQLLSADTWEMGATVALGTVTGKFQSPFVSRLSLGSSVAETPGITLFRKGNTGVFSELEVPMTLKEVKRIAEKAGVGLKGVKLRIDRDIEKMAANYPFVASASENTITLFPKAFLDYETLVKTLGYERTHIMQCQLWGKSAPFEMVTEFEKAAYGIEGTFWNFYKSNKKK